jgi:flagellar biosynthesis protein FliQ
LPFGSIGATPCSRRASSNCLSIKGLRPAIRLTPDGTGPALWLASLGPLDERPSPVGPLPVPPRRPPFMSHQLIVDLARNAVMLALLVAGPMLVVALGVGLIVSVIQAVTQIQEQTLSFVPKLIAVGATFLIALPWILQILIKYTTELFRSLPSMVT